jgi:hypothetical protein
MTQFSVQYLGDETEDAYSQHEWSGEARSVQEAIENANAAWDFEVEDGERYSIVEGDNAPKKVLVRVTRTFHIEEIA